MFFPPLSHENYLAALGTSRLQSDFFLSDRSETGAELNSAGECL